MLAPTVTLIQQRPAADPSTLPPYFLSLLIRLLNALKVSNLKSNIKDMTEWSIGLHA